MGCPHSKEQKVAKSTQTRELITVSRERDVSPQDALEEGVKRLVERNLWSDLTIICGYDRYPVHSALICPRSGWFTQKCLEDPGVIYMDESEDPYVVAAMLTYLYTLDYADEGPQMSFGVPLDHDASWERNGLVGEEILPEYNETDETPVIGWEVMQSESDFDCVPEVESVIDGFGDGMKNADEDWEASTARKTPSPCLCSKPEPVASPSTPVQDPAKPLSPLALHVQMYKAGLHYKIPCLTSHALKKFENRISQDSLPDEELIEAALYADCTVSIRDAFGMNLVQTRIMDMVKGRWSRIRMRDDFLELVVKRPGFARDLLMAVSV